MVLIQMEMLEIMVESVGSDVVENYGIADLGGKAAGYFRSVKLKGLVEKPSSLGAPSNLAVLGVIFYHPECLIYLRIQLQVLAVRYSSRML